MVGNHNLYERARNYNYTREFLDDQFSVGAENRLQHVGVFVERITARVLSKYRAVDDEAAR